MLLILQNTTWIFTHSLDQFEVYILKGYWSNVGMYLGLTTITNFIIFTIILTIIIRSGLELCNYSAKEHEMQNQVFKIIKPMLVKLESSKFKNNFQKFLNIFIPTLILIQILLACNFLVQDDLIFEDAAINLYVFLVFVVFMNILSFIFLVNLNRIKNANNYTTVNIKIYTIFYSLWSILVSVLSSKLVIPTYNYYINCEYLLTNCIWGTLRRGLTLQEKKIHMTEVLNEFYQKIEDLHNIYDVRNFKNFCEAQLNQFIDYFEFGSVAGGAKLNFELRKILEKYKIEDVVVPKTVGIDPKPSDGYINTFMSYFSDSFNWVCENPVKVIALFLIIGVSYYTLSELNNMSEKITKIQNEVNTSNTVDTMQPEIAALTTRVEKMELEVNWFGKRIDWFVGYIFDIMRGS